MIRPFSGLVPLHSDHRVLHSVGENNNLITSDGFIDQNHNHLPDHPDADSDSDSNVDADEKDFSCDDGFYLNDTSNCMPCSVAAPGDAAECLSCEAGSYAAKQSTECLPCDGGTFSSKNSYKCLPCPPRWWSPPGSEVCSPVFATSFKPTPQTPIPTFAPSAVPSYITITTEVPTGAPFFVASEASFDGGSTMLRSSGPSAFPTLTPYLAPTSTPPTSMPSNPPNPIQSSQNDTIATVSGVSANTANPLTAFTTTEFIASVSAVGLVLLVGLVVAIVLCLRKRAHKKQFALKPLVLQYPTKYVEPKKPGILTRIATSTKSKKKKEKDNHGGRSPGGSPRRVPSPRTPEEHEDIHINRHLSNLVCEGTFQAPKESGVAKCIIC